MNLVIVESPTKAKTISGFLGKGYKVESSYGHVRDLPKSKLGIDVEHDFEPQYITPRKNQKTLTYLKKQAAKAKRVILATDEDREGEAISWHLAQALGLEAKGGSVERIVFHEITKTAIKEALEHARNINVDLVNAQQARRVLDRLVGYKLSPFLWKKVARGLSAGRVQSVALRLIADREEEIKSFNPDEYWTIGALLATEKRDEFEAFLQKINGEAVPKLGIANGEKAEKVVENLKQASYKTAIVEKKEVRKNPLPPFITSTLQQEATKRFGFSAKKTMFLAQGLYEEGHISYMRTDSVNLSKEALSGAKAWIHDNLSKEYQRDSPRVFTTKSRLAQEAHEAIRPTRPNAEVGALTLAKDHARLYELIWRRFIASQLPQAIFDATRVEVVASAKRGGGNYTLAANGNTLKFDGFLKIWQSKFKEADLPVIREGEPLILKDIKSEQHFTEPPPRYNEASLIKTLEQFGIGRPSTYAPIISVIQGRNYAEKIQGRFHPTEIGMTVNRVLKEHFPEIVDIDFTAKMEEQLDDVAEGKEEWHKLIREFYDPFAQHLAEKYESVASEKREDEPTDEVCEKCGKPMVIKYGRFGKFMACSGFPECKNTKTIKEAVKSTGIKCPKCLEDAVRKNDPGELVSKRVNKGRARGRFFWGCSKYPECDHATWTDPAAPKKEVEEDTTKKSIEEKGEEE